MSETGTRITALGPVSITETDGMISSLSIGAAYGGRGNRVIDEAFRQLEEYLDGKRRRFDIGLRPVGTDFQKDVWSALVRIGYGKTVSYSDLASLSGHPGACRAVGCAMKNNPIPIFIPCHRVVRSDGAIGGFSLGTELKERLLRMEGVL